MRYLSQPRRGRRDTVFLHWEVDPRAIARLLPEGLEPDLLDCASCSRSSKPGSCGQSPAHQHDLRACFRRAGRAYIGLVLLTEEGIHMPPLTQLAITHHAVNARTYVRVAGADAPPGIFFLSLDATSSLATLGARVAHPGAMAAIVPLWCTARARASRFTASRVPVPVNGAIARGTQWLSCSMYGPCSHALNNSAIACRVL